VFLAFYLFYCLEFIVILEDFAQSLDSCLANGNNSDLPLLSIDGNNRYFLFNKIILRAALMISLLQALLDPGALPDLLFPLDDPDASFQINGLLSNPHRIPNRIILL
jgi:hypothetical protein